ncbi:uncharacterized protein Tco025E_09780, partial [Trypanosoma conorhini]
MARRMSLKSRQEFRSRVLDVAPLFMVEGAVRYAEVVNERTAWTAECDGSVGVRSIPKGTELRNLSGREGVFCNCLLFVVKTGKVWTAFSDGFIRVYDANTFSMENEFVQHKGAVECIAEMEGRIYTGGRDWKIYQWVPESYHYERQFSGHANAVRCLCPYTGSTGAVLFTGGDDGMVKAWNPYLPEKQSKENDPCMHTFEGHTRGVWALELVRPNNQLWSGGEDTSIRVWDLQSLRCVTVLEHHNSPVACLTLVGHRVWSGDKHGRILLWDLKTLSPLQELSQQMPEGHRTVLAIRKLVPAVAWKVWTTGSAGHIYCWNADSMPLLFDHSTSGEMLPHTDEERVRALERDNEALRAELARLAKQLKKEYKRAMLEFSHQVQDKQPLLDSDDGLRQKLRGRQRSQSAGNAGAAKKGDRSSHTSPASPLSRRVVSPAPSSALSVAADQAGAGVRSDVPSSLLFTRTVDHADSAPIITTHERFFPGSEWSEILPRSEAELRMAFTREAAQALGLPADHFQRLSLRSTPHGLIASVAVQHPSSIHADDVQRHLEEHPFLDVLNRYADALAKSNKALKETIAHGKDEINSTLPSKDNDNNNAPNSPFVKRAKDKEIDKLNDELKRVKKAYQRLQKEHQELHKRLNTVEPPGRINAQEEYEALKSFVDGSLKPQISRLTRMNGEKDLDLRANEERIRQLLRELELLQKRPAAKEPPGRINVQEEYEALKSFVDGSLKPQI